MRIWILVLAAVGLAGCVSLTPERQAQWSGPVEDAAMGMPADLQARAAGGQAKAQLSWSLVVRYGLHGVTADVAEAQKWRTRAVASRGSQTTAVWVPGFKKTPGHTQIMQIPVYDVTETQAQVAEACAALLDAPGTDAALSAALAKGTCGGRDNYVRLGREWAVAKLR